MTKPHPSGHIPYIWIDHRTDVPAWLAAEIGRIVVEWSDLEWQLEETIRLLVPTHVQHSRILTTGMSIRSKLTVAENLTISHVHNRTLAEDFYGDAHGLKKKVEKLEPDRNRFVHGVWGRVDGFWELLSSAGSREIVPVGRVPRAVLPQRERITATKTKKLLSDIKDARKLTDAFRQRLEGAKLYEKLEASLYRSPRQIRQSHPTRARRTKEPSAPLPPFRLKREPRRKK